MELSSLKRKLLIIKLCSERNLVPKKWNLCITLCSERVPWESWKAHLEACVKAKEQYIKALPESKVLH